LTGGRADGRIDEPLAHSGNKQLAGHRVRVAGVVRKSIVVALVAIGLTPEETGLWTKLCNSLLR
jgi:hypothetical protein